MIELIHTLKGRARFKVQGLRGSKSLESYLEKEMPRKREVFEARANALTGNVLVSFHPDQHTRHIASILEELVGQFKDRFPSRDHGSTDPPEAKDFREEGRSALRRIRELVTRNSRALNAHQKREPGVSPWHSMDIDTLVRFFGTSTQRGLSEESAREGLKKHGPNVLPKTETVPKSQILLDQFKSFPVTLLGAAAAFSIFSGAVANAVVMGTVVVINGGIGYVMESRSEKAMRPLKKFVKRRACLIRHGRKQEIPVEEITPGDVISLQPGTYVPADGRLVQVEHLTIDESTLTGESVPVVKTSEPLDQETPLADRRCMVYTGTLVTGGEGLAVVVAVGPSTELGRLQTLSGQLFPPETTIARHLHRVGRQMVLIGGASCGVVLLTALIRGYNFMKLLQTSLSVVAAVVPEGLSTLSITTLALNINDMSQRGLIVRRLRALGNLGSLDTVCFDKTGTLTENRMTVLRAHTGMKRINVKGDRFFLDEEPLDLFDCKELLELLRTSALCNETEILEDSGQVKLSGSSTEKALFRLAASAGIDVLNLRAERPIVHKALRSEDQPFMTTVHTLPAGKRLVAFKGSPPEVLERCHRQLKDGEISPLSEEDKHRIEVENARLAGDALRVLGVAYSIEDEALDAAPPENREDFVWLGLVAMADPIRKGVKELIAALHKAGISTVIITGDQSATAHAIGRRLNVSGDAPLGILDSVQLASIDPTAMAMLAERTHVYARVTPAQKFHIVQAYQSSGKVVGMLGDGVNDVLALKVSDIGIAMGGGDEIACHSADIVLKRDDLQAVLTAVKDGRVIYENIGKSLRFLLGTKLSEVLLTLAFTVGGMSHQPGTLQAIWTNLLCLMLLLEPPEPDLLQRPPRSSEEPLLGASDFERVGVDAMVQTAGALGVGAYGLMRYGAGSQAANLAFQSLTIGQLFYALNCRSERDAEFGKGGLPPNPYLKKTFWICLAGQSLSMIFPGLSKFFGMKPVNLLDGVMIGGSALASLLANELMEQKQLLTGSKAEED